MMKYSLTICLMCLSIPCVYAQNASDQRARSLYGEARAALQSGEYVLASQSLRKAEQLTGGPTAMTLSMGVRIAYAEKDYEQAEESLNDFFGKRAHPALTSEMLTYLKKIAAARNRHLLAEQKKRVAYYGQLKALHHQEIVAFQAGRNADRPMQLRSYLQTYPTGRFVDQAHERLAEMEEENYAAIQTTWRPYLVESFISDFPNNEEVPSLRRRLSEYNYLTSRISGFDSQMIYYRSLRDVAIWYGMGVGALFTVVGTAGEMAEFTAIGVTFGGASFVAATYSIYRIVRIKGEQKQLERVRSRRFAMLPTYDSANNTFGIAVNARF